MYRRTQVGTAIAVPLGIGCVALLAVQAIAGWSAIASGVAVVVLVLLSQFTVLTVTVDDRSVRAAFGPGWIRRTIPLAEIEEVRSVRNRWWYGWGIRLTPHGWLFNVQGLDAVELRLRSGSSFRVGTDDPIGLQRAIATALGTVPRRS